MTPVAVGLIALAIVALCALASGSTAVLYRPLWLDEVVPQLVAFAPRGILHAMRSGVDFQPPPYYALVRLAGVLTGIHSPFVVRLPSVIAASLTVLLLGVTLRTRLSVTASIAGALTLAAHPYFIAQAVEARPYALWIFACALTAEGLRAGRRGGAYFAGAAAILLAASHYFGVMALTAMGLSVAAHSRFSNRLSWTATIRSVTPLAAGGVAFLLLLPLARAQLGATSGRSWGAPPAVGDVSYFLGFIWEWRPTLGLLAGGVLMLMARRVPLIAARLPRVCDIVLDTTLVGLLSTALVPLLVVLVTLTYKPVIALRYAAPALLAMATLCALSVEMLPRPARWVCILLLVRAGLFSFQSTADAAHHETALFDAESEAVRQLAARGIPTVCPFRHDAYRASFPAAGAPSVAWMVLPDSLIERAAIARPATLWPNLHWSS